MKLSQTGVFKKLSQEPQKQWVLRPDYPSEKKELAKALDISPGLARILAHRLQPIASVEAARSFLHPSLADLHEPWILKQMDEAVDRLVEAVRNREKICVYGDYDVDGVTSCALLSRVFDALGHSAEVYLPNRVGEGYGISEAFIHQARSEGIGVVVTVDCGITNFDEVKALQAEGVDVIVTDHHEPACEEGGAVDLLPEACAVINPKRKDSEYPFRELAGVGVAFKLAWGLCERISGSPKVRPELREVLIDSLAYVALGTVADVAPLVGENRLFVSFGLRRLERTQCAGLAALLSIAKLMTKKLEPHHVSFMMAPRINAAGRMQDARLALDLLISDDRQEAMQKADQLDRHNKERQDLCRVLYDQARQCVLDQVDLEATIPIVVAGEQFHEGVIGIVASKLVDEFKRPAVVIAITDGIRGKGSGRSIPGLHLYDAMNHSRSRFESFGGHEMAAGFSLMRDQIEPFKQEFARECRNQVMERGLGPELNIDADVFLRQLTDGFARELQLLAPCGEGNRSPIFLTRHVKVSGRPRFFGSNNQHFSFYISQEQMSHRVVVFSYLRKTGPQSWLDRMESGVGYWDIVFSVQLNDYYSPPRLELHAVDMRPS
ncbi:MAG: single-stranded-DNA-specific exonuclease RecJ [Planctomycetota bacterium]|jgi:single-stranded-DNA-specific exonuclease